MCELIIRNCFPQTDPELVRHAISERHSALPVDCEWLAVSLIVRHIRRQSGDSHAGWTIAATVRATLSSSEQKTRSVKKTRKTVREG